LDRPFPSRRRPAEGRAARWRAALACCLIGACSGPPGAGRQLGDDLGSFAVDATEADNSCGPGALGSTPRFSFEVELSRDVSELFWDGQVGGRIDPNLEFVFAATVKVPLRGARPANPGCAVIRSDQITGLLEADAGGTVRGFTDTREFAFATDPASRCTPEDELSAGLPRLPCGFGYTLEAERTRAPENL